MFGLCLRVFVNMSDTVIIFAQLRLSKSAKVSELAAEVDAVLRSVA